jgi:hypothetical protein
MTPEGRLLASIKKYCNEQGIQLIRLAFRQGMETGWPDLCVLIPGGKPLFMELKAPGKKTTARQLYKIRQLAEAGYDVEVHDQSDTAIRAISQRMDTLGRSGVSRRTPHS